MVIVSSIPTINEEMEKEVTRAIREEFLVGGESVSKFEEEFADFIGTDYAVAVSSGTDALVIALRCLDIKKKVLTPAMTFVATPESIVLAGAKPKFCDIDENSWNISINDIQKKIDKEVEAIMPVHLYGLPCDMKEIIDIAEDNSLSIVEDSAQSHGGIYDNKKVGTFGKINCFSFYTTKNMTSGGNGGMITTNDKKLADKAKLLREHGGSNNSEYIGYNARLNTINAAFARVQLKYLDEWNNRRREIADIYYNRFKNMSEIKLPLKSKGHTYHLFGIQANKRDDLKEYLRNNKIFCGIHYPKPVHLLKPYIEYGSGNYPVSEYHAKTTLSLPMYPTLKDSEVEMVCDLIKKFYGG